MTAQTIAADVRAILHEWDRGDGDYRDLLEHDRLVERLRLMSIRAVLIVRHPSEGVGR